MIATIPIEIALGLAFLIAALALLLQVTWARRSAIRLETRLSEFQHRLVAIESRLELRPVIPPMSIFLEPIEHRWHVVDELCRRIDDWMIQRKFARIGYFRIEELEGEELCAYLSADCSLVAAVRMASDTTEPFVEFCFDLGDGERGGTSNPPNSTIRPATDAIGCHFEGKLSFDFTLIDQMYLKAVELMGSQQTMTIEPERIAQFFEEAHIAEMSCLVRCGGITDGAIRDVLRRQGILATDHIVGLIQRQWQQSIEDYLLEYSARGRNCQVAGQRVLVVYQGSVAGYLVDQLQPLITCSSPVVSRCDELNHQLRAMLDRLDPREAVSQFRSMLPARHRLELVDQLMRPIPADVYALPL